MISPRRVRSATPKAAITPRLRCFYIALSCCTRSRWFSCRQYSAILLSSVRAIDSLRFEVAGILLGKGTAQTALPFSIL